MGGLLVWDVGGWLGLGEVLGARAAISTYDLFTAGSRAEASAYEMFSCDIVILILFCLECSGQFLSVAV